MYIQLFILILPALLSLATPAPMLMRNGAARSRGTQFIKTGLQKRELELPRRSNSAPYPSTGTRGDNNHEQTKFNPPTRHERPEYLRNGSV
ncbi:hypothetical protein FRC18_005373 [Serendipita sp. 400]|nr:hypothetical protein FRC18_005373 [Serendipita sp. 400]